MQHIQPKNIIVKSYEYLPQIITTNNLCENILNVCIYKLVFIPIWANKLNNLKV